MTTISATHDEYVISFANGRRSETIEGSYQDALAYARELAGSDIQIGHDGDLTGGGDRTLFWAADEDTTDDDGARALGEIRRQKEAVAKGRFALVKVDGGNHYVQETDADGNLVCLTNADGETVNLGNVSWEFVRDLGPVTGDTDDFHAYVETCPELSPTGP